MKILVLKNGFSTSLKLKLKNVSDWFSSIDTFEFTEEKVNLTVKNSKNTLLDQNGNVITYDSIDETWYDENISKPAKARGFDIVILIEKKSWLSNLVEGFGWSVPDYDVEEIAIKYFSSGTYDFNGVELKGDKLTWLLIHEILHRYYNIKKLTDNTHKYFSLGTPEKCLEDFKIKTWKYFSLTEKTGSLGHTVADLDIKLVDKLDELRGICGFPFNITSGYRTEEENAKVGGVAGSAHTKRLAVDIACTDGNKRDIIIGEAYKLGFIGKGIDEKFVHLDLDSSLSRRIWLYKK